MRILCMFLRIMCIVSVRICVIIYRSDFKCLEQEDSFMNNLIGTLIRCSEVTAERLAFYKEIGLNAVQLAGVYEEYLAPTAEARKKSDELFDLLEKNGLSVPGLFLSYTGQDWKNIAGTIGIVPEKLRCERMLCSCRQIIWAKHYGIKYISCHIGDLPQEGSEAYKQFALDFKELVKFTAALDMEFLLETGMENADGLAVLFKEVSETALGLNFDPANLVYYNCDKPMNVIERHFDAIRVVHCKDAVPGEPVGKDTDLRQGAVDLSAVLTKLLQKKFNGPLIIERELPPGPEQENDIKNAVKYIKSIIQGVEK